MSYIGRGLEQVDNISKLDNITFNGGTTYALTKDSSAFTPISSNAILISVSGVIQQGNFSVDGTNIVFNTAVASSESCDFIMHYGTGVAFTPADSSVTKDKANFISTSSSAGLQIKGDGTTDGTLQLNCSQNTHGIKLKSPNHASSSSYTITFPATDPSANKMLQTDGSGNLSFVDAPSGAMTLIASASGTSSVGDVSFNDCFSATYANYFITYALSPDRSGNYINFRFQKADDTTFNSDYNTVLFGYDEGANLRTTINSSHSDFPLHQSDVKDDTSELFGTVIGYMYVYHPYTLTNGGLRRARVLGQSHQIKSNGNIATYSYSGQIKQNSENVAGIRFRPNANYITQRRVRVYGLKDS